MVLYGITLVPLAEELMDADPTILSFFYANDAAFDVSARRSAAQMRLSMDRGLEQGYFPDPTKSLFIAINVEDKEAAIREFDWEVLNPNYLDGSQYLGGYLGPRAELEEWVSPKVEACDHGVCTLAKIANWYPQLVYSGLEVLLQLEWQYL